MTIDLGHNVISGFEHGFRDIFLVPDLSRLWRVPWDPATAWCMGDLREGDGTPYAADPRHAVRRAVDELAARGLTAIVAPELEFYLVDPDTYETYTPHLSSVYTVGSVSDPKRRVPRDPPQRARPRPAPAGRRAGVRLRAVRDQPRARRGARGRRPQPAVQDDGQADGVAPRAAGHVHGQAARRRGLGDARPRLAGERDDGANAFDDPRRRGRAVRPRPPVRGRRARAHARADGLLLPDRQRLPAHAGREPRARRTSTGASTTGSRCCATRRSAARRRGSSCGSATAPRPSTTRSRSMLFAGLDGIERELELPRSARSCRTRTSPRWAIRCRRRCSRRSTRWPPTPT